MTSRRFRALTLAVCALTALGVACSLILPLDGVQCSTDSDCQARGPSFARTTCVSNLCLQQGGSDAGAPPGAWDCLAPGGAAASDPGLNVRVTFVAFDPTLGPGFQFGPDGGSDLLLVPGTYAPKAGVTVEACGSLDPTCANPLTTGTTDNRGAANLTVSGAFDGYFLMQAADSYPSLEYPGRLAAGESRITFSMTALVVSEARALGGAFGFPPLAPPDSDAGYGQLFVTAFDCQDRHAAGVSFGAGADGGTGVPWYLSGPIPSRSATRTDGNGTGGFINFPTAGESGLATTVTATFVADAGTGGSVPQAGQTLMTQTVLLKPGYATFVLLRPRVR